MCRLRRTFFGLGNDWTIGEERNFLLMYYGNFTYTEARNLPIYKATWWLHRINQEIKKNNKSGNTMPGDLSNSSIPANRNAM